MLKPEEAWNRIARELRRLPVEPRRRREALGCVLAETVTATVDVPAADVSAMDGYAVGGEVVLDGTVEVVATVAAGDPPGLKLERGAAARIMTGAPVPEGADRIVPVEDSDGGLDRVRFKAAFPKGAHIRHRAEILAAGSPILPASALLTPGALALLATHGYESLRVHRPPRVAMLATGNEVVPPNHTPAPGQLRDSHTDFLLAAGRTLGLELTPLGISPDDPEALARFVRQGLEHDVFLLCGGVSMGEYDFAEGVLTQLGCRILFDSVAVQPGKPLVAAVHKGGLVFGLPGNPASVMVTFWLFVRPALRRLMGFEDGFWQGALIATAEAPLPAARGRDRFLPTELRIRDGRLFARALDPRGSHDLAAFGFGTALTRIRAGAGEVPAGGLCEVLPLGT